MVQANAATEPVMKTAKKNSKLVKVLKDWDLYFMLVPGLIFLLIFKYTPMYGLIIAFMDFNIFRGVAGSEWVGLKHFENLFINGQFVNVLTNTILISLYKLIFLFPAPIIVAILMNEILNMVFKRTVQSIIYLPHFISWVIISGLFINLLSLNGIVNSALGWLGLEKITFFMEQSMFRSILVFTDGWKEVGWGTIVYLAAITSIDPQQYEAATIDGANKFRQIWHITLPGMAPVIVLMLILRLGNVLEAGTEQILVMYNPVVYEVGDVIGTFVYRIGLGTGDYSFTTAVGLFESVVGFILIVTGNHICKKYLGRSIW